MKYIDFPCALACD